MFSSIASASFHSTGAVKRARAWRRVPGRRVLILFSAGLGLVIFPAIACHRQEKAITTDAPDEPGQVARESAALAVPVVGFGPGAVELDYEASFIGSEACEPCHVEHYELRTSGHMAMTSRRVTADNQHLWFSPERLAKPVKWPRAEASPPLRYRHDPTGVSLEARGEHGVTHRARVAAVFGSGNRGFTPISVEAGKGIRELRLSYFHKADNWIMTPGSAGDPDPLGYVRSPESSQHCLECHTTVLAFDGDRLNLEASVFGIGCERCHGPGSAHATADADSPEASHIFNPGSLDNKDQVRFCSQCHRRPADLEPHRVLTRSPELARHAGAGLMLSACYRRSPAASSITCLDCHSPHRNIDTSRGSSGRSCRRCHDRPEEDHQSGTLSESSDCIECHMPRETRGFFGLEFTEHWIRVPDQPPPAATRERSEYAHYLEASYRRAIARPGTGKEKASKLRMRLGKLLLAQGQKEVGLRWLREALSFAPLYKDRILTSEFHDRAGRTAEAIAILSETIRVAPEHNRAYYTLAHIHMAAGEFTPAQAVLEAWEEARPGDPVLQETREELKLMRRGR